MKQNQKRVIIFYQGDIISYQGNIISYQGNIISYQGNIISYQGNIIFIQFLSMGIEHRIIADIIRIKQLPKPPTPLVVPEYCWQLNHLWTFVC